MTNRFVHRRLYRRFECGSGSSRRRLIRRCNSQLEVDVVIPDVNGRISRIPRSYVNATLKRLGPYLFDKVVFADCKLKVGQREYWGHELPLSWNSLYFRAVFAAIHFGEAHPDVAMPQMSDEGMPIVTVPIESPEETNFDEMLYWVRIDLQLFEQHFFSKEYHTSSLFCNTFLSLFLFYKKKTILRLSYSNRQRFIAGMMIAGFQFFQISHATTFLP